MLSTRDSLKTSKTSNPAQGNIKPTWFIPMGFYLNPEFFRVSQVITTRCARAAKRINA
ncbi:hypothetical protein [Synechococcus sp. CC9311]|uniref:hypothetical protein n=1 Tax=Synechococcus sp. (strain CC9311) TaxID=64471 RepID=UPI0000DDB229|nr:hypothetical protein [Synechococcus sp. CC9311]ABI45144.1 hypothetical protein sync_2378 [Synechococcus sp. CC9311]